MVSLPELSFLPRRCNKMRTSSFCRSIDFVDVSFSWVPSVSRSPFRGFLTHLCPISWSPIRVHNTLNAFEMADVTSSPTENVRDFVKKQLLQLIRETEGLEVVADRHTYDHACYKLDHLIDICAQPCRAWPGFIPFQALTGLLEAKNILLQHASSAIPNVHRDSDGLPRGIAGRPSIDIPEETLVTYLRFGFTQKKIAECLGVSSKTVKRRIQQFNLDEDVPRFSNITDVHLDAIVRETFQNFPNCGIR